MINRKCITAPTTTGSAYTSMMRDAQTSNNNNGRNIVAQKYLTNCRSLYSCIHCRTHLANHDDLVSRSFQGNRGRAYLFNSVINIVCGPAVQRELNTGSHAVADIFCSNCDKTLGWKYEKAFVETQKYKEGKFIIELEHVVRENRHLELDKGEIFFGRNKRNRSSSSSSSSSLINNPKPSSLAPLSSSPSKQWSSSSATSTTTSLSSNEEVEEDDEELMFPFYDDLCGGRSSYPSNLSSSHHNRMRRSLYLDSTPYDWKYSATSSSIESPLCSEDQTGPILSSRNLASSLDSAYSSTSPSTSSSSPRSPSSPSTSSSNKCSDSMKQKSTNHIKSNRNYSNNNRKNDNFGNGNKNYQKSLNTATSRDEDEYEETQFKFEADKLEPSNILKLTDISEHLKDAAKQSCDYTASDVPTNAHSSSKSSDTINIDFDQPISSSSTRFSPEDITKSNGDLFDGDSNRAEEKENISSSNSRKTSLCSSISLDDEKFYDCLTDHDVSKLMVSSDCPRMISETGK